MLATHSSSKASASKSSLPHYRWIDIEQHFQRIDHHRVNALCNNSETMYAVRPLCLSIKQEPFVFIHGILVCPQQIELSYVALMVHAQRNKQEPQSSLASLGNRGRGHTS